MAKDAEDFWRVELRRLVPDPAAALEDALGYLTCPVCQVICRMPWDYFRTLPVRWSGEPALRAAVSSAGGFCNGHSWQMARFQSSAAIARVLRDVLDELVQQASQQMQPCPVCRLEMMATAEVLDLLQDRLSRDEERSRLGRLFGLCYPHWRMILARDLSPALREFLLQWQSAWAQRLQQDLAGFVHKNTAELKDSLTADETRAWRRALIKTAGMEGL